MGTVKNGKKWAGACVNGKVVSGLVKNGLVFYRMPVSTYRRRIMVGDNLSNRTIFQDFPDGFYKSGMSDGEQFNLIESNNINIYEYYIGGSYNVYCGNRTNSNLLYRYDLVFGKTMTKKDVTTGNYSNAIVTEVNENEAYRHIFIEDENIRPLKVGDIITDNTVFYFTFPDDFHVDIQSMTDENRDKNFIELDDGSDYVMAYVVDEYRVDFFTNYFSAQDYGVCYAYDRNTGIRINLSSKLAKDITDPWGNPFTGTVTMVDKNNEAYQHILVDATTLGA